MPQEKNPYSPYGPYGSGCLLTTTTRPPLPQAPNTWPRKKRVCFIGETLAGGGVERWLGSVIKATSHAYEWTGVGCEDAFYGQAKSLVGMDAVIGVEDCVSLAQRSDIALVWCTKFTHRYRYESRAEIIATWHGGPGAWTSRTAGRMDPELLHAEHAVSDYARSALPRDHRERTTVIHNAVDPSWVAPSVTRHEFLSRFGLCDHRGPIFVYVGRLSPEKGWGLAINGASRVRGAHVIAVGRSHGDAGYESGVAFAMGQLFQNCSYAGWLGNIGDALQCATALVAPSVSEGCQYAVLEAALSGVPVIGTRTGVAADCPSLLAHALSGSPTPEEISGACSRISAGGSWLAEHTAKARSFTRDSFGMDSFRSQWCDFLGGNNWRMCG